MRHLNFAGLAPKETPENMAKPVAMVAENTLLYGHRINPLLSPKAVTKRLVDDTGVPLVGVAKTLHRVGDVWLGFDTHTTIADDPTNRNGDDSIIYVKEEGLWRTSSTRLSQGLPPIKLGVCPPASAPLLVRQPGQGCTSIPTPLLPCDNLVDCGKQKVDVPELRGYVYTYVVKTTCDNRVMESAPSPPSAPIDVFDGDAVMLSAVGLPPIGVTALRWYRAVGQANGEAEFLYIGETPASQPIFKDNLCPQELGAMLATERHYPVPPIDGVTNAGNTLLLAWKGRDFYVSLPGLPHAFTPVGHYQLPYRIVRIVGITPWVEGSTHYVAVALTEGKHYAIGGRMGGDGSNYQSRLEIKELQAWYPAVSERAVTVAEGSVIFATDTGLASIIGNDIEVLLSDITTRYEWPVPEVIGYGRHVLVMGGKTGMLFPYSKLDKEFPGWLTTHTVEMDAVYSDYVVGLHFVKDGVVYKWAAGDPMLARWRGVATVNAGLWRPTVFKVVGSLPNRIPGFEQALEAYDQWRSAMFNDNIHDFLEANPRFHKHSAMLFMRDKVRVIFYMDGEVWYDRRIGDNWVHRTPAQGKGINWEVELQTTLPIHELHYQTSADDLTTEGGIE